METRKLKGMQANSSEDYVMEEEQEQQSKPQRVIRFATKEEAEKAHRKVMKVHAALLRRLAE